MMYSCTGGRTMGASRPRKQVLFCSQKDMPPHVFAVVRISWYRQGKPESVEELQMKGKLNDEMADSIQIIIEQALRNGADVSVLTAHDPKKLGID